MVARKADASATNLEGSRMGASGERVMHETIHHWWQIIASKII